MAAKPNSASKGIPLPSNVKVIFDAILEIANSRSADGRLLNSRLFLLYGEGHQPIFVDYSLRWLSDRDYMVKRQDINADGTYDEAYWALGDAGLTYIMSGASNIVATSPILDNDVYEPLELDRDDKQTQDTIELIEAVTEGVRGNNSISEHRRNSLIWNLTNGIEAIRASVPTQDQMKALILQPLKWIMGQFVKAELGEMAKKAHEAVSKLLGL